MSAIVSRRFSGLVSLLCSVFILYAAWSTPSPGEVIQFDMTGIFNRDGIWSIADPSAEGFDQDGHSLIEDGYNGWPGLPSDGKVQDFQLGDFDNLNMLSIFSGDGDTMFDLSGTGQHGHFEKLRFLTGAANGYSDDLTDKLMVRLVYDDASTQDVLVLSQDWWLGQPPRTPPAPLTLAISGMVWSHGEELGPNFVLYAFDFPEVDSSKTLTQMVFMESHEQSTIGDPWWSNRFNILGVTGYAPSGQEPVVPEASTLILFGSGLIGMMPILRRRCRRNSPR